MTRVASCPRADPPFSDSASLHADAHTQSRGELASAGERILRPPRRNQHGRELPRITGTVVSTGKLHWPAEFARTHLAI